VLTKSSIILNVNEACLQICDLISSDQNSELRIAQARQETNLPNLIPLLSKHTPATSFMPTIALYTEQMILHYTAKKSRYNIKPHPAHSTPCAQAGSYPTTTLVSSTSHPMYLPVYIQAAIISNIHYHTTTSQLHREQHVTQCPSGTRHRFHMYRARFKIDV
jgi:hypothetical protein